MSVKVRTYRTGGWEVDVTFRLPNGCRYRERRKAPVSSKSAAHRWGEHRERHLLQHGLPQPKKEVPTLEEFAPRFIESYARANRQKPSGIAAKESILRVHLLPALGPKQLDQVSNEDVQRLKQALLGKAPKTVNNVLTVLGVLLKKAVEWHVLDSLPCTVRLLPTPKTTAGFHDFDQFKDLVEAAQASDRTTALIVLLGGEAGLRCGEMIALEWRDVDLAKRLLCIERSDWNGTVTSTKGGRLRHVPMTERLAATLRQHRHLQSPRVLCLDDGTCLTRQQVQYRVKRAARQAGVTQGVHILRHTFCSHLAMRGAPVGSIQALVGHRDLSMTQRYMHLSPAALDAAIRLLEVPQGRTTRGEIVETATSA